MSSDLSWSDHVGSICSKARNLLGMLYRRLCPHLEYASSVWSPYRTGEIKSLEDVQKFALRIGRKSWDQSYQSLLELFQLPTLEDQRIYLDLCAMFKIVHNLCYCPCTVRASCNHAELPEPCLAGHHTTQFQKSFVMQSIKAWNSLPLDLLSCPSVSSFKFHVWN